MQKVKVHLIRNAPGSNDWTFTLGDQSRTMTTDEVADSIAAVLAIKPSEHQPQDDVRFGPARMGMDAEQLSRFQDYLSMFIGAVPPPDESALTS